MSGERVPVPGEVRPEESEREAGLKAPTLPAGEPSGPGSAVQAGQAMPGTDPAATPGESMVAPTMPGEDSGVV